MTKFFKQQQKATEMARDRSRKRFKFTMPRYNQEIRDMVAAQTQSTIEEQDDSPTNQPRYVH